MREPDRGKTDKEQAMKKIGGVFVARGMVLGAMAHADVVATARSPEGAFPEFRVVLDAVGEPVAVANFMGLVDGSQRWLDPETGVVRGGAEDAFYDGMVFHALEDGFVLRGGLRGVEGEGGETEYTGGPGYTVIGKTNEVRTPFGWGALALREGFGPHSGGSEIAFLLAEDLVTWTVFGKVKEGDKAGLSALAERVESGGAQEVRWEVDTSGATAEELAALDEGRAALPDARWVEVQSGAGGLTWHLPGTGWLKTETCTDLQGEWSTLDLWDEAGERDVGWKAFGLDGMMGFAWERFAAVKYPRLARSVLAGKWRVWTEHTGKRIEYEFDFAGRTGVWVQVGGGVTNDWGALSGLSVQRLTGNSFGVMFTLGSGLQTIWTWYYLGLAGEAERGGRVWMEQLDVLGRYSSDWGMYGMAEGWSEGGGERVFSGRDGIAKDFTVRKAAAVEVEPALHGGTGFGARRKGLEGFGYGTGGGFKLPVVGEGNGEGVEE